MRKGAVLALGGETGRGKSTVLAQIRRETGGGLLRIADVLRASEPNHPLAIEETAFDLIVSTMRYQETIIVDDFQLLQDTFCCSHFLSAGAMAGSPGAGALRLCHRDPARP